MPTLLIVNITCNQGSTGKISEQIGLIMKEQGWDVYLAHGARRVNTSKLNTYQFSTVRDEYLHYAKGLIYDGDGLGSKASTKRLVNYIDKIKPDVIQLHNLHGYFLNYKILFDYLKCTNIPVVMTLHDCWSFTGHCVHPIIAHCEKWLSECYNCPIKKQYPKATYGIDGSRRNFKLKQEYLASYKYLHIVTVSAWLGDLVRHSLLKEREIHVFSNGVDVKLFKPMIVDKLMKFTIIAVSNVWHKDKGLFDFIELSQYLKEDEQIILVGFDSRKNKYRLPKNILTIPYTNSQEELVKLYNQSDVVVSLSYAETFGLTVAEGFSCGTPAVVYDNTAQPALITSETGLVVKTGDVPAVYDAISIVRKTGKAHYSDSCRKRAELYYNKELCYRKYVELYENILTNEDINYNSDLE